MRVKRINPGGVAIGINAFAHSHDAPITIPFEKVPEELPGKLLVAKRIAVAPGGNTVMSYLDVVSHEWLSPAQVRNLIESLVGQATQQTPPWTHQTRDVFASFNMQIGFGQIHPPVRELKALLIAVVEVLEEASAHHR